MNIPLSWLKEAANIQADTAELLDKMVSAGNAVEGVEHLGADITNVVVGRVGKLERHPDADKLWVTETDIGTEVLQIITGADNLKFGDLVPVAVHGATLANGLKIKKGKMRGLDSNGMLCSIDELGYTVADFPEASDNGIYVFQDEHPLGADVRPIMQLLEDVADFDILSNRPDTNSVLGMAREAAAAFGQIFTSPKIDVKENGQGQASDLVTVEIADPDRCPRYIARVVQNVKIGPSPQWLRRRLSTAGVRPINNIVDITNYVMLEHGQPLHAFDISAVAKHDGKHGIVVRTAAEGEKFTTLDGEERTLTASTLLIADHQKPIGIAGVMGGENSKILDDTTTILFESANFDASNIRHTSRALGLRTDASARYEKGQDPNQALASMNRAMELVEQLACGDVVPGMVDAYPAPRATKTIQFKPCAICALLGVEPSVLGPQQMCDILARIGIATVPHETYIEATIPTYRADMTGEADIAEEVARFYGLNNIPARTSQLLSGTSIEGNNAGKNPRRKRQDAFKHALTALGYSEAMTYPFESPKVFDKLNIGAEEPFAQAAVTLQNPLGEDFSILRTVPFGGLLDSIARNHNKGNPDTAIFEFAHTYNNVEGYAQEPYLALATYGHEVDFLSLKGDIEALFATVTNRPASYEPFTDFPFMHPGRTALVSVQTSPNPRDPLTVLGVIGELHPAVSKNFDINTRVYVAWLEMPALHQIAEAYKFKFQNPSVYPAITRDIAIKVAEDVPAATLEKAIRDKAGQYFASVALFDVYQGEQVGAGYKSMAYNIIFRASDRTLTTSDVEKSMDAILANLKKHGAEIRA